MGGIDMVRQVPPNSTGVVKSNKISLGRRSRLKLSTQKVMVNPWRIILAPIWIVKIKENLEILFKYNADVFVAGTLFLVSSEG
ncbi:hypothetical protein U9R62_10985 [Cylindrospermopsis raciborskii DSH]|uniref:hypothetical protein n=1 Tax=Cylindrospermopsis raciborskii TaxID=77022 RepID=UPI002ED865E3